MSKRLSGKRVLLSGGVANIGFEVAKSFIEQGAKVAIVDKDVGRGKQAASRLGEHAAFFAADISAESVIGNVVREATSWLGGLDALCLNAGVQRSGKVTDLSVADWDLTFAVNVRSAFFFVREALPHLRQSSGASIVLTSSLAGKRGGAGQSCYSASKAALNGFAASLAIELGPERIRVNAICPGWVDTDFNQPAIDFMGGRERQNEIVRAGVPLGRQATPAEISPLFIYLVSDESSYVTGQAIGIDGGAYN